VTTRFVHISDLHVGAHEDPEVEQGLARLVAEVEPQLVVASGDLSHRGRPEQLEHAASFLRSLGPPVLAVPGNHDMPYNAKRVLRPWSDFERIWETAEPTVSLPGLHVVGLNSASPFRRQGGDLGRGRLERGVARLNAAAPDALRVAVLHHHVTGAPWRAFTKRQVARRKRVLEELAGAGADLILGGHIHQATVIERHEFQALGDDTKTTIVVTAPGFGRPRPHRLGEARGLHVYEAEADAITVRTYGWSGAQFAPAAERRFARRYSAKRRRV
jgi:3',5'-cyclic AMP phosphodiesterase CpdA